MICVFLISCLLTSSWAQERIIEPPLRIEFLPPEETQHLSARNVSLAWIRMPVDHFDPKNPDTFLMRFMFNEQFFGGDGYPVFILVGGEWNINAGWLLAGNMFEMARENRGYQIYTEHRYYGETLPYSNFTTENLRFLNVDQALADLAYFIHDLKKQPRFAGSKIILYGGSYAANMVLWFKQRYPHLVLGTVASSGPILGKVDFTGYLEVVHEAFLLEGGQQCINTINEGIADTIAAMATEEGRRLLEQNYSCISGNTPMEKIGGYIAAARGLGNSCWRLGYENFLASYSLNTNCKFDEEFVFNAVERVNQIFGGLEPNVNNTINIHGYIDPWRALGVYDRDLKDNSPTASHCFDMQSWLATDTIFMTHVQQNARRIVTSWLST
ncbi:hypothetical protein K1T71_005567 [Dendrolimus kikuchii]|uniref:Uncharacterized protein n=1 Tax=Dendrolimus kikuchii TaxID=765133 RepID=A0ACC1D5V7_9NEOP|nr:hypothetical protein K1T71_005567 [Dendrolimus kikuchii]